MTRWSMESHLRNTTGENECTASRHAVVIDEQVSEALVTVISRPEPGSNEVRPYYVPQCRESPNLDVHFFGEAALT